MMITIDFTEAEATAVAVALVTYQERCFGAAMQAEGSQWSDETRKIVSTAQDAAQKVSLARAVYARRGR